MEAVVNCTGSESDYRRLMSPLVADLLRQGMARPDPLSLWWSSPAITGSGLLQNLCNQGIHHFTSVDLETTSKLGRLSD